MKKYFIVIAASFAFGFYSFSSFAEEEKTTAQPSSYIFNVAYDDVEEAIGKELTVRLFPDGVEEGARKSVSASINGRKLAPLYSANKPVGVEIRGLRSDEKNSRWNASLIILDKGSNDVVSALPLSGKYIVMEEVPVLKRAFRNGEVITQEDIELKYVPQARIRGGTVIYSEDIIGKTPLRAISPQRPLRGSEITDVALINKNALVQMRYRTGNMEITASGQALADGVKGDVIEVRNIDSKKTARAVVVGNNLVDVIAQPMQASRASAAQAVINY